MENKELLQLFKLLDTLPNPVTLNEAAVDEQGNPTIKSSMSIKVLRNILATQ